MKLKRFDNIHQGNQGFLIGGAHSLNSLEKEQIDKLNQEILVGANKAYKIFNNLNYMVFLDSYFYSHFYTEFKDLAAVKFTHLNVPKKFASLMKNLVKFKRERNPKNNIVPYKITDPISLNNNTGSVALRISYLLGLNPIYILGVELNHKDIDNKKLNFHKDYRKKEQQNITYKTYDNFYDSFKKVIEVLKSRNIEVYSCSKTSRLNNIIEYRDLSKIF